MVRDAGSVRVTLIRVQAKRSNGACLEDPIGEAIEEIWPGDGSQAVAKALYLAAAAGREQGRKGGISRKRL